MKILDIPGGDGDALRQFRDLPHAVYKEDPIWAPGSESVFASHWAGRDSPSNRLFHPVVAVEARRPVARAVAILKTGAIGRDGSTEGYVGFYECLEGRADAARGVLARCERLLRDAGATSVVAPKVDNQLFGCQVGGFGLPHLCLTPHNPPGYSDHLRSAGYARRDRLLSLGFTREATVPADVTLPGLSTRTFDRNRLDQEIGQFHDLQAAIFGGRPGYIPRSLDEDRDMISGLLPVLVDDLVILAEDRDGTVVGLLVALPDFYQALGGEAVTRLRILSIGARPGYQRRGIGVLMASRLMRNLAARPDYTYAEASVILSRNRSPQNLARRFHAQTGRSFETLEKAL